MSLRSQNKPLVICIAIAASALLVGIAAFLDVLAPKATLAGFFMRTVPLAVVIPFVLVGFNALCDRCDGQVAKKSNETIFEMRNLLNKSGRLQETGHAERQRSTATVSKQRRLNGTTSAPITVPVSVHERSFRTVVPGKKWWIGQ